MTTAEGIKNTTIALRECLIEYYYGDCVDRLTNSVDTIKPDFSMLRPTFARDRAALENQTIALIKQVPLFVMHTVPKKVTIFTKVFGRSPELRGVERGLREFLAKYLDDVEVVNYDRITYRAPGNVFSFSLPIRECDDTSLVKYTVIRPGLSSPDIIFDTFPDMSTLSTHYEYTINF